jgi:hypothetical protein
VPKPRIARTKLAPTGEHAIELYSELWDFLSEKNYCGEGYCTDNDCYSMKVIYTAFLMAMISFLELDSFNDEEVKPIIGQIGADLFRMRKSVAGRETLSEGEYPSFKRRLH